MQTKVFNLEERLADQPGSPSCGTELPAASLALLHCRIDGCQALQQRGVAVVVRAVQAVDIHGTLQQEYGAAQPGASGLCVFCMTRVLRAPN